MTFLYSVDVAGATSGSIPLYSASSLQFNSIKFNQTTAVVTYNKETLLHLSISFGEKKKKNLVCLNVSSFVIVRKNV